MTETTMPATEAVVGTDEQELVAYELAYHVLPTVAEGEVNAVTDTVKSFITNQGGVIFDEEAAERFELAYEIEKYLEGKYRRFSSAYFGWIRFNCNPAVIEALMAEVEAEKHLLRNLLVRLTKVEEANPFRFHEVLKESRVTTVDTDSEEITGDEEIVEEKAVVAEEASAVTEEVTEDVEKA